MARTLLPADADPASAYLIVHSDEYTNSKFVLPLANVTGDIDSGDLSTTDDTYQGSTITGFSAGATIAQWEAVYMGSGGTWLLADCNGSGTYPARGIAVEAGSVALGELVVLREGKARNDAWNWTIGGNIYLSGTPGGLTQTATAVSGERLQAVGFALSADTAFFNFQSQFQTLA